MRKLDIRSIRSPSLIRIKLIELSALPQSSPVCGLIKVYEMERLAQSYGVIPPNVFYDVFMSQGSQKQVNESDQLLKKRQPVHRGSVGKLKAAAQNISHYRLSHYTGLSSMYGTPGRGTNHAPMFTLPPLANLNTSFPQYAQIAVCEPQYSYPSARALSNGASYVSALVDRDRGPALSTASRESDDALVISIPRTLTPFPLSVPPPPMPTVAAAQVAMVTAHDSNPLPTCMYPAKTLTHKPFQGSLLQNLAKKISQKTKKLGAATASRNCPSCHRINPSMKKRCQFCGEFLIGRPCPQCGTLNHNRTKECFKCNSPIASPGRKDSTCARMCTGRSATCDVQLGLWMLEKWGVLVNCKRHLQHVHVCVCECVFLLVSCSFNDGVVTYLHCIHDSVYSIVLVVVRGCCEAFSSAYRWFRSGSRGGRGTSFPHVSSVFCPAHTFCCAEEHVSPG